MTLSVGIGPARLVAKIASRVVQAGRLRRDEPRAGVRALRLAPPGLLPGIGPKTAERLGELG